MNALAQSDYFQWTKKKLTLCSIKEVFSVTGVFQRDKYFNKPFLRLSETSSVVWEFCVCHLNSALGQQFGMCAWPRLKWELSRFLARFCKKEVGKLLQSVPG